MDSKLTTLSFKGFTALQLNLATDIQVRLRKTLVSLNIGWSHWQDIHWRCFSGKPDQSEWPRDLWGYRLGRFNNWTLGFESCSGDVFVRVFCTELRPKVVSPVTSRVLIQNILSNVLKTVRELSLNLDWGRPLKSNPLQLKEQNLSWSCTGTMEVELHVLYFKH
jgi:hypothetical protein